MSQDITRQGQIALHFTVAIIAVACASLWVWYAWPNEKTCIHTRDAAACAVAGMSRNLALFHPFNQSDFSIVWTDGKVHQLKYDPGFDWLTEQAWPRVRSILTGAAVVLFGLLALGNIGIMLLARHHRKEKKKHLRGAEVIAEKALAKLAGKENPGGLSIGTIPIPRALEPLSFLFAGSPGSGKSQAINRLVMQIRKRGDAAVVADAGGELFAIAAQKGDALLNVFDKRTLQWSPFAEVEGPGDLERIVKSIIPNAEGERGEWRRYAQQLLEITMSQLLEKGHGKNSWLLYYCCSSTVEEWAELVAETPAQPWFAPGNDRMFSNVRAAISTFVTPLRYLNPTAGRDAFSVTKWSRTARERGAVLWLPYREASLDAVATLVATWLDLVTVAQLSSRPDRDRRMWVVVDELAAIGKIESLQKALAQGRKYGLSAIAGYQSIAQLRDLYGENGHRALLSCLQTRVALATSDFESAKALADDLGDAEVSREEFSSSGRIGEVASQSKRDARAIEKVILPSQLQRLSPLHGYIKLAGDHSIAHVTIPILKAPERLNPWLPNTDLDPRIRRPEAVASEPNPAPEAKTEPPEPTPAAPDAEPESTADLDDAEDDDVPDPVVGVDDIDDYLESQDPEVEVEDETK